MNMNPILYKSVIDIDCSNDLLPNNRIDKLRNKIILYLSFHLLWDMYTKTKNRKLSLSNRNTYIQEEGPCFKDKGLAEGIFLCIHNINSSITFFTPLQNLILI